MKTRIGLSVLLAALLGAFCLLTPRVSASGAAAKGDLIDHQYRVGDLPVWSKDGQFHPNLIMSFIQSSVSPKSWEANGGKSSIAPYPQNTSLVISTTRETHQKIQDFLEKYR